MRIIIVYKDYGTSNCNAYKPSYWIDWLETSC